MGKVAYWFALAAGAVMAALPLKFGDQLDPLVVDLLFYGGFAIIAACAVIAAAIGIRRIMKGKKPRNDGRGDGDSTPERPKGSGAIRFEGMQDGLVGYNRFEGYDQPVVDIDGKGNQYIGNDFIRKPAKKNPDD